MALETGGLDAQVEQRMDAYRGNPQQLQQRYGANKELLDLLALQKLTSEKQAAARDMQMQQQQQPGTIAQQREQEALELTKQEMSGTLGQLAANTKGTLDQKQSLQQKNLNKMAQNASKPQLGAGAGLAGLMGGGARPQARPPMGNPQTAGLAGVRMAQAAKAGGPVRMAQGGIVSFVAGKKVTLTEDQKKKAREIFGADYDRVITPLLQMDEDSPEAAPFLRQIGPPVQSTPISRGLDSVKNWFSTSSARANLQKDVNEKFRSFAATGTGAFKQQSPEQQAYAKSVLAAVPSLSDDQLNALLEVPFTEGMDPTAIAALPVVSPSATTPEITAADPAITPQDNMPEASPITYDAPVYETEMSQLDDNVLNVPVKTVGTADETEVDAAQADLLGVVGNTPDAYTPEEFERTKLKSVPAADYMNATGLMARDQLLNRAGKDFDTNVDSAISGARESADAYTMRDAKNTMYREQGATEQAYQDRMLDPKRVEQLKRMETYGGGAKYGRGGIGQGFVESESRFDELEGGGLKTLRGIQDNAIANDFNMAGFGMAAGSRAGSRAQADRNNAGIIYQNEIARQQAMALDQQAGQQAVDTANTSAANIAMSDEYKIQAAAINQEVSARQTILNQEATELKADTARLVQQGANEQAAAVQSSQNKITQAQNADSFAAERAKIQLLDIRAAEKLFYEQLGTLEAEKSAILDSDENYIRLTEELAKAETEDDFNTANDAVTRYADALEAILAGRFATSYARLAELRQRIEQGRAQNIYTRTPPRTIDEDDPNVTVDPVE